METTATLKEALTALDHAQAEARVWADGEAVTAYVILEGAVADVLNAIEAQEQS